jgi:hypothetical protein
MQNIRFQVRTPDLRPALIFDHVEDAAINGFSVQAKAESVVRFIDSRQTPFTAVRVLGQAAVFLQLEGAENEAITIDGGDRSKAASAIALRAWRHGKLRENTRVNKGEEWIRTSLVESC